MRKKISTPQNRVPIWRKPLLTGPARNDNVILQSGALIRFPVRLRGKRGAGAGKDGRNEYG